MSSSSKKRCRNEACEGSMPTSSACSQLQPMWPLKAKVWLPGATKQSISGKRRRFAFAHISPENAALLHDRIAALLDAATELRILRLGGRFQTLARCVEQPAVKGAAQAALFEPAEGEVGATMRAVALDQAIAPLLVAKQHEVFAEQFYRTHRSRPLEFIEQRRRLPVHPHQSAAGVVRARARDQVVLFLAHHGALPHPKKACGGRRSQRIVRLLNKCSIIVARSRNFASDFHGQAQAT